MSEGVNDIMFALECAYTGYFSWKSYAIQKAVSIAFTIVTCGVAAYMSRGAKFSKFGYKIGGDDLAKLAGRKLIKEVGKTAIINSVAFKFGKKFIQTAGLAAGNKLIEMATEQLQKTLVDSICENAVKEADFSDVKSKIQSLCETNGCEKTEKELQKITENVFGTSSCFTKGLEKFVSYLKRTLSSILEAFGSAAQKTSSNELGLLVKVMNWITKGLNITQATAEAAVSIGDFQKQLNFEIRKSVQDQNKTTKIDIKKPTDNSENKSEDVAQKYIAQWKVQMKSEMSNKIAIGIVQPVLTTIGHAVADQAKKEIKKAYRKYRTKKEWRKFNKIMIKKETSLQEKSLTTEIITEQFESQMNDLLIKTKNPLLYAEIIRKGGLPIDRISMKAVANCLGRPIRVETTDGSESPFPDTDPSKQCTNTTPIILKFQPAKNKNDPGHFVGGEKSGLRNDCCLGALKAQGHKIDRSDVANEIETDENIQRHVRLGIQKHFNVRKNACGGIMQSPTHFKNVQNLLRSGKTNSRNFRDKTGLAEGAVADSGNHELCPTSEFVGPDGQLNEDMALRNGLLNLENGNMDYYDLFLSLRIDTSYVVFITKDGNNNQIFSGHSGALYSDPGNALRDGKVRFDQRTQMTKGQAKMHNDLRMALSNSKSPADALRNILSTHLTIMPTGKQIRELDNNQVAYTKYASKTKGVPLNLKNEKDRNIFALGYERERYKQYKVLTSYGGTVLEKYRPKIDRNDPYVKQIDKKFKNLKQQGLSQRELLRKHGEILMQPAPIGIVQPTKKFQTK